MNASDHVDPDAHTQLDFEPLDPEPTGSAESLAWSGEQEEIEDYPFSPDSAPTAVVEARSGTPVVIAAVILSAVAIVFATVVVVMTMTRPAGAPVAAPVPTTPTTMSVAPPPPHPPTPVGAPPPAPPAPTVTVTAKAPVPSAAESNFVAVVADLPTYVKPGRINEPAKVLAGGYRMCRAMDNHPNDSEAAVNEYYPRGTAADGTVDYNGHLFAIYAANYLCTEHSGMWENF